MYWFELVEHRFEFEVQEARIVNFFKIVFITKNSQERFVVQTQDQVGEAEDKEATFVKTIHCGESLTFYWMISGLGTRTEARATVDCLPACLTAPRSLAWTAAVFLSEPESEA